jgi:hypothetical protein
MQGDFFTKFWKDWAAPALHRYGTISISISWQETEVGIQRTDNRGQKADRGERTGR